MMPPPQKKRNLQLGQYCAVTCPTVTLEKSCSMKRGAYIGEREGRKEGRKEQGEEGRGRGQGREEENTGRMDLSSQPLIWHVRSLEVINPIHTTGKKPNKLKISNFSQTHRELRSQSKPLPPNLERQTGRHRE